jgi:hypothetical protein
MHVILVRIPNNKTSRLRNTGDNCQPLGKVTGAGCQRILWQATVDNPKPCTTSPNLDESRFELVPCPSVPQVYHDYVFPTTLQEARCGILSTMHTSGVRQNASIQISEAPLRSRWKRIKQYNCVFAHVKMLGIFIALELSPPRVCADLVQPGIVLSLVMYCHISRTHD